MHKYGWIRHLTPVILSKDDVWLRIHFTEKEKHTDQSGVKYHAVLTGDLWTQVLNRMVHPAIAKLKVPGEVAQMTYHRVNQNSVGQAKDDFHKKSSPKSSVTIIVAFTDLDVYIETKTATTMDSTRYEMVLCYIKPMKCLIIKKGVEYRFQDNNSKLDRRWLDIKYIPLEKETKVLEMETDV